MELTEALSDKVNVFTVAFDTRSNDEDFFGGNVVHHKLLHHASINVADVVLETEAGHAKRLISIGCSQKQVLIIRKWVIFRQVIVQVVALLIFGAGHVCSEDGTRLKSTVDHHLEHISDIVLDAMRLEIGALLIILHSKVTAAHLNHAIVDCFIRVLKRLQVGVFESE